MVFKQFASRYPNVFDIHKCEIPITHSKKDSVEISNSLVLNGRFKIGNHEYISNWAVADYRYDILIGMPWHREINPTLDYTGPGVLVYGE